MSVARFLREVGRGYRVRGIVDFEQVRELARINGDLGRLGGLLKLWLTDDVRTARFGEATVQAVLERIETTKTRWPELCGQSFAPRPRTEFLAATTERRST